MNREFDLVVLGGGASGVAASISAAREGCSTLLMDRRSTAGGTAVHGGLTTLCGLFDDGGNFLNEGFALEFAERLGREDGIAKPQKMGRVFVQIYRPSNFQRIANQLLAREPLLQVEWNSSLREVVVNDGRIEAVNGIQVKAVIDCSGVGELGRMAGEALLATDASTQAPAVNFLLDGVDRKFETPWEMARIFLGADRAGIGSFQFMPCADSGTVAVKYSGALDEAPRLLEYLKNQVAGFENCLPRDLAFTLAKREGVMIMGRHILTGKEVLKGQKFPDAVARACWPIEQWSSEGRQKLRYLPPGEHYEIPRRALRGACLENFFMAGKSLSADIDAAGSARVMGICLATGAAAGRLAASYVKAGQLPAQGPIKC